MIGSSPASSVICPSEGSNKATKNNFKNCEKNQYYFRLPAALFYCHWLSCFLSIGSKCSILNWYQNVNKKYFQYSDTFKFNKNKNSSI